MLNPAGNQSCVVLRAIAENHSDGEEHDQPDECTFMGGTPNVLFGGCRMSRIGIELGRNTAKDYTEGRKFTPTPPRTRWRAVPLGGIRDSGAAQRLLETAPDRVRWD
jgi:hypothetical protein